MYVQAVEQFDPDLLILAIFLFLFRSTYRPHSRLLYLNLMSCMLADIVLETGKFPLDPVCHNVNHAFLGHSSFFEATSHMDAEQIVPGTGGEEWILLDNLQQSSTHSVGLEMRRSTLRHQRQRVNLRCYRKP